jgi:serine/threonine protein kinase
MNEETIFATALQMKTAGERQAYLDDACGGNAGLRVAVEELLHANSDAGSFLAHAPVGIDATVFTELSSRDTVDDGLWTKALPFLTPCDKPGRIGTLNQYEIMEVVGHGGMGAVLRAFDTKLSRVVAVKIMSPTLAANPTAVKRFLREATTAASVHHDHVVTIHAVDDGHQPPYLVMQFIEGQTLQQKIDREGALELKQILRIGSQAAAGLAAAHKLGLIHRDVKPANILLENGVERVKITDFGLARAADDVQMTQTGIIAGTPQYMSPEQARGEPIDARSDLFSLGSVLYTMCAGRPAFRADNPVAVLRRICDDTPRPIHELNAEIPPWLEGIVDKLLAKNPVDRFSSAEELAELLDQCLAHVQNPALHALPESLTESLRAKPEPRRVDAAIAAPDRWRPLRPVLWTAAALVPLFLVLAITEASGVTNLAATVIRIASGDGTLVIESNDPGIKVAIDGEEVAIHGTGVEEVRLRPGSYKIAASKDGQPAAVDQELVTISRGDKRVVRVALERSKLLEMEATKAAWQPPTNPDPDKIRKEAQTDIRTRRYELALAKLTWYHENALVYKPSHSGVRLSFALQDWMTLADAYPPALARLKAFRDEAVANVKEGRKVLESFQDLVAINRTLGEQTKTRDLFVLLHSQNPQAARRVYGVAQPALIKNKEYKLCNDYVEPAKDLERLVFSFRRSKELAQKDPKFGGQDLTNFAEKSFTNGVTTLVALLAVNGRKSEAETVAEDAKNEWDDSKFRAKLNDALQGNVPQPWPSS